MGVVKLAGLAAIGSLGLASLVVMPVALATSAAQAKPTPSGKPVKPAPTVTKTKVKTVAPAQPCDVNAGRPKSEMTAAPWPQNMLNFPDAWSFTQGQHVKVAVVDSGVDTSHSQLPRVDSYDVTNTTKQDCVGHGTAVAGIIAAQDRRSAHVPFLGVAPKVHLISVKVALKDQDNGAVPLATGIKRAAALGAKIICVSSQTADFSFLKAAVRQAQDAGALVVAAAGNTDPKKRQDSQQALYPASYDGVVSVGAVGVDGKVADFSDAKSRVSVVAPGTNVISTWPGNSYNLVDGTSFAAPYVAGTAALVESRFPNLSAAQVKHRLEATADGSTSVGSGHGIINPLRAVTAVLPEEGDQGRPQPSAKPHPVALVQPDHEDPFTRTVALSIVGGALGVAGVVAAGGLIIPAGRRRNWRPSRRAVPTQQED